MRKIAIVLVIAVVGLSCKRAPNVRLNAAEVKTKVALRTEHAMAGPAISKAFDQLFAGVVANPEVLESGTALLGVLAADPVISQAAERLMAAAQASPELKQSVVALMRSHPGATADEIGALVGKRFEANWGTPSINAAWMGAWNRLLPKLEIGVTPRIFESTIGARFEAYVDGRSGRWGERLTALNGGQEPTSERASDLYVDHAWSEERIEQFLVTVLANPRFQRECGSAVHRLLQVDAVRRALREAAATFIADATVQDAAGDVLRQLTLEVPPADVIGRDLDRLLQAPVTARTINQLVARLLAEPEVPKILVDAFDHVRADKQLSDAFDKLFDGW